MKVMKPSVDTDVEHYEGVVLGGGNTMNSITPVRVCR